MNSPDSSNSAATWLPRQRIGSYELMRELARGGMGEIWLARQSGPRGFDRLVVLKRIIAGDEDSSFESMFIDEARIAASLQHPNVVQVFEFGQHGPSFFIAMEYLPGQSLSRVARAAMGRYRQIPSQVAIRVIADAAAGLGYAHQRKGLDGKPMDIVHRDVSPQNIHVTYDAQVKVLDFGIAQAAGRITKTRTGLVRGKVAYMAPEQALATLIDARADVFSLGVVLFELLTGTRLYGKLDDVQIITQLATTSRLPRPSERAPAISPELDDLIARSMSFDPAQRPADGKALHDELQNWLRQQTLAGPTLDHMMRELFSNEIEKLSTEIEPAERTPQISNPSLPDLPPRAPDILPSRSKLFAGIGAGALLLLGGGYLIFRPHSATPAVLKLVTQPDKAVVTVDGKPCQQPCKIETTPGEHLIDVTAPGFSSARREIILSEGEQRTIDLALQPNAVAVAAVTPPPVADVAPADAGKAAAVVAPANPVAVAVADPVKKTVPPKNDKPANGNTGAAEDKPASTKSKGKLTLDTEPWTNVFLGKQKLGETPLVEVSLPAGKNRLRLVNDDEKIDTVIEIDIQGGGTTVKKLAL